LKWDSTANGSRLAQFSADGGPFSIPMGGSMTVLAGDIANSRLKRSREAFVRLFSWSARLRRLPHIRFDPPGAPDKLTTPSLTHLATV
jgi:hypothetical protein